MEIVPTNYAIADYCDDLEKNKIIVNRDYQRSDKVWPPAARSFLIETIILGYPVPKISLYQRIDVKTRKSVKEIVDGQQRSKAIMDFYIGKLRLSRTLQAEEIAGASYADLSEEMQGRFLNYSLSVDLFVAATSEEIREVFRRMNSYTVPLNPEETRHATYQGEFKWFIYSLSRECDRLFKDIGVFGEKAFVRMLDAKLLTEIIHALLNGIRTTNKSALDSLYKNYDAVFPQKDRFHERILSALQLISRWKPLHEGPLAKPYMMYSLVLAVMHLLEPVGVLREHCDIVDSVKIDDDQALVALSELAESVESGQARKELSDFVKASTSKTNVAQERATRFATFCSAIIGRGVE
jgi:hypothetical protein